MNRVAIIDIGSNSLKLKISHIYDNKLYLINKNIRNKSYIYMENKQVDKKTHKTYNKNISLEMLSSLGAGDGNRTHVVSLEG